MLIRILNVSPTYPRVPATFGDGWTGSDLLDQGTICYPVTHPTSSPNTETKAPRVLKHSRSATSVGLATLAAYPCRHGPTLAFPTRKGKRGLPKVSLLFWPNKAGR